MFLLKQPWHLYGLFFPFLLLFLHPCSPERNLDFIFFLMITGIGRTFIPFSFFSPSPLVLQVAHSRTHTFHMHPDLRSWCVSVNVALTSIFTSDSGLFPSLLPCLHPHLTVPHKSPLLVPTQVTPEQPIGGSSQMFASLALASCCSLQWDRKSLVVRQALWVGEGFG